MSITDQWYYSHAEARLGPFSGRRLRELADGGSLLPTDTVWKEGVEKGVSASKVKNLFPVTFAPVVLAPAVIVPLPPEPIAEELPPITSLPEATSPDVPPAAVPEPAAAAACWQTPARKGTAKAGKGAQVVGQDGVNVKFRKLCTTCGTVGSSWTTMPIRSGIMRAGFFCPKCRKNREVLIHGSM